jgi:hypothetical protein
MLDIPLQEPAHVAANFEIVATLSPWFLSKQRSLTRAWVPLHCSGNKTENHNDLRGTHDGHEGGHSGPACCISLCCHLESNNKVLRKSQVMSVVAVLQCILAWTTTTINNDDETRKFEVGVRNCERGNYVNVALILLVRTHPHQIVLHASTNV